MLANKALSAAGGALTPSFISSSTAFDDTSTNTINLSPPSGIQNGDMLVFIGFLSGNNATVSSSPAGFIFIAQSTTTPSFAIYYKIASSESGTYTFTWTGNSGQISATILLYRNARIVNTLGAVTNAASSSLVAAAITPSFTGTLLAIYGQNTSSDFSSGPSGMTLRASVTATGSGAAGAPTLGVYDLANQTAVSTGTKTATTGSSQSANSLLVQITNESTVAPEFVAIAQTQRSTSGTTLTINKPTGTVQDDLMIAVMSNNANATWTGDTGWTEVADQGTNPALRVAYKVAGASEGANYTFTSTISSTLTGTIITYRYATYDTIAGSFTTGANPLVLTAISPTASQAILLACAARGTANVTFGIPTGMSAVATDNDATSPSYRVSSQTVPKGPTGTRSVSTGSSSGVAGIMLAIKPTRTPT